MVKSCCEEAGIQKRTNHSLRATSTTLMFKGGVPEKVIQERTGHRSLEGLRKYEHTSPEQHIAAACVVGSKRKVEFESHLTSKQLPPSPIKRSQAGEYSFSNYTVNFFSLQYLMKYQHGHVMNLDQNRLCHHLILLY